MFMLGDVNNHVEISGRAAVSSGFAFALQAQPGTGLDAGRNLYFDRLFALNAPRALTTFARRSDHLTRPATSATGARHRKEALLKAHLTRAFTGATGLGLCARGSPRATTSLTGLKFGNAQLGRHSDCGLLLINFQIVAQ